MLNITGSTKITGIIGKPLSHSLSPFLHNMVYKKLNKPYVYVPFPVEDSKDLKYVIKGLMNSGVKGVNVTVPYKEDVICSLDRLSEDAEKIGAVNVIRFKDGIAEGFNTDGAGYILSIKKDLGFEVTGKKILVLGAGGSSRALVYQMAKEGLANITIANRTLSKAENIVRRFSQWFKKTNFFFSGIDFESLNLNEFDIVVNCTSSSLGNNNLNFPYKCLTKETIISDLIYPLNKSPFLIEAKKEGFKTIDGLYMLAYQAALSFEIWFNSSPPFDLYKKFALRSKKV